MPLIKKGIKEILQGKDKNWAGADGNAILNGLKQTGEAFLGGAANAAIGVATDFLADISPFGKSDNNYADLGDGEKDGGGITEYGMYRDMQQAAGTAFMDAAPNIFAGIGGAAIAAANSKRLWDVDIREATVRMNSVLEERSYVDFYFPNASIGEGGRRRVAFFENPTIREDRMARYATQNIVARNEPARLYVGSDARRIRLDFTFTLPHVEYFFKMCYQEALAGWFPLGTAQQMGPVEAFASVKIPLSDRNAWINWTTQKLKDFFGLQFGVGFGPEVSVRNGDSTLGPRFYEPTNQEFKEGYQLQKTNVNTINEIRHAAALSYQPQALGKESMGAMATFYTQFVIDTIRASVVGDTVSIGPVGPPIVRFRHGTVFDESPFIVKNYNISYPSDKGYEFRTLLPRQVKFSLNLEEFNQTHGSHHGLIRDQVPDAASILDLNTVVNTQVTGPFPG